MIERTVENNGVKLHTRSHGTGPAVIMLHGLLLGSVATWYFGAARELTQHQVILYDLRGHGYSDMPENGYDMENMLDDLRAVFDSYQLETVSLVGHSYGAAIAAHFALRYPEKVTGLFLVDMPCDVVTLVAGPLKNITDREQLIDALPGDLPEKFHSGKRGAKKLVDKLDSLLFHTSIRSDLNAESVFTLEQWKNLPANTSALYGDSSNCLAEVKNINAENISLNIIPGGHFLPLEAGLEVSKRIKEYFYG